MDLRQDYSMDKDKEQEGAPLVLGDATVWVRRANYGPYRAALEQRIMRARRTRGRKRDEPMTEILARENVDLVPRYLIVDWENVKEDGKEIPFSVPNAKDLFTRYPVFLEDVFSFADDIDNYREEDIEATAGKSESEQSSS